jgi:hypothetical protein
MAERKLSDSERAVMEELLDSGAVNFEAIGSALTKHGPELAREGVRRGSLAELEPWEVFCGTMRWYVRLFVLPPVGGGIGDLERFQQASGELRQ